MGFENNKNNNKPYQNGGRKGNNKNQKKRENYFDRGIKMGGENFLEEKTYNNLVRDARNVFRDIAYGNIDPTKYIQYFTNTQFISSLVEVSRQEVSEACVICMAMDLSMNTKNNSGVAVESVEIGVKEKWHKRYTAYSALYNGLCAISLNCTTDNLILLCHTMAPFRYDI